MREIDTIVVHGAWTRPSAEVGVNTAVSWRRWRRSAPWALVALMAIVAANGALWIGVATRIAVARVPRARLCEE